MRTMGESSEECGGQTESADQSVNVHATVTTQCSSTASDDSSSDLMEHFMSELDLVFSDILAEEVSQSVQLSINWCCRQTGIFYGLRSQPLQYFFEDITSAPSLLVFETFLFRRLRPDYIFIWHCTYDVVLK